MNKKFPITGSVLEKINYINVCFPGMKHGLHEVRNANGQSNSCWCYKNPHAFHVYVTLKCNVCMRNKFQSLC
jgi:hypothetical protein